MEKRQENGNLVSKVRAHYFGQAYGGALREPVEGDARHEAHVTIHHFQRQGVRPKETAKALEQLGVGSAKDIIKDYSAFLKGRPGDD